jgi:hypothetical protein
MQEILTWILLLLEPYWRVHPRLIPNLASSVSDFSRSCISSSFTCSYCCRFDIFSLVVICLCELWLVLKLARLCILMPFPSDIFARPCIRGRCSQHTEFGTKKLKFSFQLLLSLPGSMSGSRHVSLRFRPAGICWDAAATLNAVILIWQQRKINIEVQCTIDLTFHTAVISHTSNPIGTSDWLQTK